MGVRLTKKDPGGSQTAKEKGLGGRTSSSARSPKLVANMLESLSRSMSRSMNKKFSSSSSFSGSTSNANGHGHSHHHHLSSRTFRVGVVFLDDTHQVFHMDKKAKGLALLDVVFNFLELVEREYFGLVFNGEGNSPSSIYSPDVMRWIDPDKPLRKQLRSSVASSTPSTTSNENANMSAMPTVYFRVKFYVTDPSRLHEEFSRYHLYLQVKHDLIHGSLTSPLSTACLLTSFVAQSTLGDHDPETCKAGYLAQFKDLRTKSVLGRPGLADHDIERRIMELHKLHKGQSPAEAEFNFLEHAKRLEMYGISLHNGKDSNGKDIQLGVTSIGLVVFQNRMRVNTFSWSKIVKISFKRKQFFIQLRKELTESYDTLLGFNLASYRSCKNLWKSAVEHHSFFRLHSPKAPPKKFLQQFGSRFRYSGNNSGGEHGKTFPRAASGRKTLPLSLEAKKSLPRLASPETSSIGSSVHSNGIVKPHSSSSSIRPSAPRLVSGSSPAVTVASGSLSSASTVSLAHRAIESFNNKVQSLSTKLPKKAWQEEVTSDDEGGFLDPTRRISSLGRLSTISSPKAKSTPRASDMSSSTITPSPSSRQTALSLGLRLPFADESSTTSGQSSSVKTAPQMSTPKAVTKNVSPDQTDSSNHSASTTPQQTCQDDAVTIESNGEGVGGLVFITITPDERGRFGFNVKGGADQKLPIIVSRVGANTPADKCYPKLNEGDQVVFINGRDVSGHTHDQVVNFIRASSEPHSGQLILAVKQNAYLGEDVEEPAFQYVPESPHSLEGFSGQQGADDVLSQSILLLEESLESGAIVGQFEQLYRRNPALSMTVCHSAQNMAKNRYRDISPYDSTRYILKECPTGDYINANHVVMTIPGSGIVNRYIATQGPLHGTCADFWYMTWESQSDLIIMLTTIVERGRIKCHKYWPDLDTRMDLEGGLKVRCTGEQEKASFAFRDFEMSLGDEKRHVSQMAYVSWPDHGVPDSPDEFVEFVEQVRTNRQGSMCPTVVHCSAGIGRTGVLILMETALCLAEANQPIYPIDITRQMRDQRASMIQTASQYRFVCEAILKVYKDGRVKPLPEFCEDNQQTQKH